MINRSVTKMKNVAVNAMKVNKFSLSVLVV